MKIVVDHVKGSRRGQRQEFPGAARVSIGRHPRCDVSFDAHRDLDASSRHAEVRQEGERYVLRDVGSSNGTWVGGNRVSEVILELGQPIVAEFGSGGPELRIWVGADGEMPEPIRTRTGPAWGLLVVLALLVLAAAGGAAMWLTR